MITNVGGNMWVIEGKIEHLAKPYGVAYDSAVLSTHVGIDDLSRLLAKHVGKRAKVRIELEVPIEAGARVMYPKTADYPDEFPFEVVVVERNPAGEVRHVEACSRHSLVSEARHRAQVYVNGIQHPDRYTCEIVTPTGMVQA